VSDERSASTRAALAWFGRPTLPDATPEEVFARGRWGPPDRLCLPLDDRGLLLADGLFETVLVADGRPWLLADHLSRWRQGAALLGLPEPPAQEALAPLIAEAIRRGGIPWGALRLNWSRGGGGRGIELPVPPAEPLEPRFWLRLSAGRPTFGAVRVLVSETERRHPPSVTSRCKTFAYGWAVQARREARAAGADDALVCNTAGELCCATTANLLLRRAGRWLTPPLSSGCLPGVMRGRALAFGLIEEAPLLPDDLIEAEAALLLNSLDARPVRLPSASDRLSNLSEEARQVWRRCLGSPAPLG
jgi:branched-subunit amino acid aminotransferase/4-amino-4-deoxychorismate lyase